MKALFALGLALLLAACQPEPPSSTETSAKPLSTAPRLVDQDHLDQTLSALVHEQGLVGVSALVYEQGEEAYFGAFGFADREAQKPMARDTLVRLYSMTKPITGVALMMLYEEGLFDLNDPLAKYLPEYADMQVYLAQEDGPSFLEPARPITVYDTLRHTAGFIAMGDDTVPGKLYTQLAPFDRDNTLAEMSQRLSQVPLLHQPGKQWVYGPGTDVQARLVEVLSGQKFEHFLLERIFLPLKMYETGHHVIESRRKRFAALYEWTENSLQRASDEVAFSDYYQDWPLRRGGTGLVSSLDDYMRFALMLANGGELDGVRILKPETIALMATDALPDTVTDTAWLPNKGRVGFGINFAVRHSPPANAEEASGAVGEFFWDGYANTLFWVDPKNKITAVLFTQYIPFGPIALHKPFRDAVYHKDAEARAPKPAEQQPAAASALQWQHNVAPVAPSARHENGFVAVGDRLYLLGGRDERPLDIFDPASGRWTQGAKPPFEIHHMQAIAYDNKLYVIGALTGGFPEEPPLTHVLIYDPATDAWSSGPEIPTDRRRGASGVVLHEGLIYVVGGNTRGHMSGFVPWLDVFDPVSGRWTALADAPHARDHFHAAVIDGKLYAAAGRTSAHDTGNVMSLTVAPVDVYDIASKRWSTLAQPLPTQRAGTATVEIHGKLVVIGGESVAQLESHREVEAYDPATQTWITLAPLPVGRHGTQATVLNGKLHVVAGSGNRGGGPELNDHLIMPLTK